MVLNIYFFFDKSLPSNPYLIFKNSPQLWYLFWILRTHWQSQICSSSVLSRNLVEAEIVRLSNSSRSHVTFLFSPERLIPKISFSPRQNSSCLLLTQWAGHHFHASYSSDYELLEINVKVWFIFVALKVILNLQNSRLNRRSNIVLMFCIFLFKPQCFWKMLILTPFFFRQKQYI